MFSNNLITQTKKIQVFWDVTPCGLVYSHLNLASRTTVTQFPISTHPHLKMHHFNSPTHTRPPDPCHLTLLHTRLTPHP